MVDKIYKIVTTKFKVAETVTVADIQAKLNELEGFEELSVSEGNTIKEITVNDEVFSRIEPNSKGIED